MASLKTRLGGFLPRGRNGGAQAAADQRVTADLLRDIARRQDELGRELAALRTELHDARNDVWASKVVRVGDRLLVGSRHENLVFLLEADDQLIAPRFVVDGEYEPHTTAFLKQIVRHDSVCIDVGANFGYYSCLMGHLAWAGKVYAFEADPKIYELLVDNIAINWCEGIVEPANVAVAAEPGELTLHRWLTRSGNSGVIPPPEDFIVDAEPFTVRCINLDSLVGQLPSVDVIKIDVEGAESMVVAGMSELIARYRPTVVLEWSPKQITDAGFSPTELAAAIGEWNVDISTLGHGGQRSRVYPGTLESLPYQNIVLTPAEHAS